MPDIWSKKKRSQVMRMIRKTDSSPELVLRNYLRRASIPFRTYAALPGTPDIVIDRSKLAVFIHGCFWHGCPQHYRLPHSNVKYWSAKLAKNKARDRAIARKIRAMGWHTTVVWECQVRKDPRLVVVRLQKRLGKTSVSKTH
jgi:DNA mismatch endonuclease (patch repair protein)